MDGGGRSPQRHACARFLPRPLLDASGEPLSRPEKPHWLCTFDLDGDGALDLVAGAEDGSLFYFARAHLSWD